MVWVVSLSTTNVSTRRLSPVLALFGIRSLRWRGRARCSPLPLQCSTPEGDTRGTTSIVFGENQLSPDLFSLSPLATAHPLPFQREWVRPSTRCYPRFSLAMARSSGFGSTPCYLGFRSFLHSRALAGSSRRMLRPPPRPWPGPCSPRQPRLRREYRRDHRATAERTGINALFGLAFAAPSLYG